MDQILCDGLKRGRKGSHAAIERILKHEPSLERAELWQRIRRLKNAARDPHRFHSLWTLEDEQTLREGYQNGWQGKRQAVREPLKRHPDWRPHLIWRRAAKLGLVRQPTKRRPERSRVSWSEEDYRILLDLAGYKSARTISKLSRRSEAAVRTRLSLLGKSSRVHLEGFSRFALARELHLSANAIQRFIVEDLLEVRDPRVTRESLDRLQRSGRLQGIPERAAEGGSNVTQVPDCERIMSAAGVSSTTGKLSRAKRAWAEVARSLNVPRETVEKLIARGVLKLYDPRITEKSLRNFCRRHGSLINRDFLSRETRDWLQSTMDSVPRAREAVALSLTPLRKHARVVHQCKNCGRSIRGNVFFRHLRRCEQDS